MKRLFTVLACLLFAAMLLASCSPGFGSPSPAAPGTAAPAPAMPDAATPPAAGAMPPAASLPPPTTAAESVAPDSAPAFEPAPLEDVAGFLPILTPSQMGGRMMSYNVTLNLQTTDFVPGLRILLDTVGRTGGYLEFEHVRGNDMRNRPSARSADYSFRVPSERLNDFLVIVENNFNIVERLIVPRDDTAAYRQADTRLDDLRGREQRLTADLGRTGLTPEQRLEIEQELTRVRMQISDLAQQQSAIEHDVIYSVVSVALHEVIFTEDAEEEELDPTFGEILEGRVGRSVNAFLVFCQGLLLAIIAIAPVLVVVAILGVVALIIVRIVKKCKAGKKDK